MLKSGNCAVVANIIKIDQAVTELLIKNTVLFSSFLVHVMVSECVKDGNHMDLSSRAENN